MIVINKTKYFLKKAKKLLNKNLQLILAVNKTVETLSQNPKDPKLGSHKVKTPKFGQCFSSSITKDLRLIWAYSENDQIEIIDLLDIGSHSGSGKVY